MQELITRFFLYLKANEVRYITIILEKYQILNSTKISFFYN